jgi:transcriptional regulator with XRE-family HTH domain
MVPTFGARLRQQREELGISLSAVAEQTKIKRSLLDALECDDVRYWPAGFFGRAFVRAYAQAVGLNPDVVVREFLEAHPEPIDVAALGATNGAAAESGLRSLVGRLRRGAASPAAAAAAVPLPMDKLAAPDSTEVVSSDLDFEAVAALCTAFARVQAIDDLRRVLQDAAALLGAAGMILWIWDDASGELKPALAHGYSDHVLAQLPPVRRDTNNPTAAAFRSQQPSAIEPTDRLRAALAVPLLTPAGCAGVLAIEFQHGAEHTPSRRAASTIFAALLAQLVAG